ALRHHTHLSRLQCFAVTDVEAQCCIPAACNGILGVTLGSLLLGVPVCFCFYCVCVCVCVCVSVCVSVSVCVCGCVSTSASVCEHLLVCFLACVRTCAVYQITHTHTTQRTHPHLSD